MSMSKSQFSNFFTTTQLPAITALADQLRTIREKKSMIPALFNVRPSTQDIEQVPGLSGMQPSTVKDELGGYDTGSISQGYNKTFTHLTYGLKYVISKEADDDKKYFLMEDAAKKFPRSFFDTKERLHANVFNNGFTTEQAGDNVALFSSAHPYPTGGTQSNILSTAAELSFTSLQSALNDFGNLKTDHGQRIDVQPKYLLIPRQLYQVAINLIKNEYLPGTANNDLNYVNTEYSMQVIVWDYLNDNPKFWYVLGDKESLPLLSWSREEWNRKDYYDEDIDAHVIKGRERFSYGAFDYLSLYGSNPV